MGQPHSIDARRFYRVALQRMEDAEFLLRGQRNNAAVYLAGYAVECMLKCLLIESAPVSQRQDILREFRGRAGHDCEMLYRHYLSRGYSPLGRDWHRRFLTVSDWSTDMRYTPGIIRLDEAETFVEAARIVVSGIERRV